MSVKAAQSHFSKIKRFFYLHRHLTSFIKVIFFFVSKPCKELWSDRRGQEAKGLMGNVVRMNSFSLIKKDTAAALTTAPCRLSACSVTENKVPFGL